MWICLQGTRGMKSFLNGQNFGQRVSECSDLAIPPIGAPESLSRAPLKGGACAIRRTRPEGAPLTANSQGFRIGAPEGWPPPQHPRARHLPDGAVCVRRVLGVRSAPAPPCPARAKSGSRRTCVRQRPEIHQPTAGSRCAALGQVPTSRGAARAFPPMWRLIPPYSSLLPRRRSGSSTAA